MRADAFLTAGAAFAAVVKIILLRGSRAKGKSVVVLMFGVWGLGFGVCGLRIRVCCPLEGL